MASKNKIKKLVKIPVIVRRLLKKACQLKRDLTGHACEICGLKKGDLHIVTGKPQKVDSHHVMSRSNKNSPLKFDLRNLACLCTDHHKTSRTSAHKHGLWFATWFLKNRPEDAQWILDHTYDEIDLTDRNILNYIEECLTNNKPLDFKPEQLIRSSNESK